MINSDAAKELVSPLAVEEIIIVTRSIQSDTFGPDRFPVEFFKKFLEKLSRLLLMVHKESLHHGSLPPTLTQAPISLLLKKVKDPIFAALTHLSP